jgi:hypothetical protein
MSYTQTLNASQPDGWNEDDWEGLLLSIRQKECTPFLGAGACAGVLPLGSEIAAEWADEYDYPFQDTHNLVRVAQYLSIKGLANTPKRKIRDKFSDKLPDFNNPNEPHRVVADLELPVYITTNYDDFMMKALERVFPKRTPRREVCQWYMAHRQKKKLMRRSVLKPTPDEPLVFHLHGTLEEVESMVLTEDDYLDFLMYISEDKDLIPARIEEAFASSSMLFMGYSLEDMNFKVLFRKLASYIQRNEGARHVSVQLAPKENESTEEQINRAIRQREYLGRHLDQQKVKVYWGTCEEFTAELRERWEKFKSGK